MQAHPALARGLSASLLALVSLFALGSAPARAADAADQASARLQVSDPYSELRTGPGRGFPVFFVEPREHWITIELRHTDWYRVRTEGAQVGWVQREQLRSTLAGAGQTQPFRDLVLDDYLGRRAQLGVAWGRFNAEPMLKMWSSYRVCETLTVEATLGQVQGAFAGTNLWHVNLVSDPWSDRRFSPFFSIGVGKLKNFPNSSLVGANQSDANLANASLGARYYLSQRFVLRADYTLYTAFVSDTRSTTFRAPTAGISFFF